MKKEQNRRPGAGIATLVLKDNKVLLGKRHTNPEKASSLLRGEGTWTMPGGKLDFGQDLVRAAKREALEETGIKIKNLKIISLSNDIVEDVHFLTVGFLCTDFEGEPKVMEPEEITEWQWFPIDKLPYPIFFPSAKILKNYLAKKIYSD